MKLKKGRYEISGLDVLELAKEYEIPVMESHYKPAEVPMRDSRSHLLSTRQNLNDILSTQIEVNL